MARFSRGWIASGEHPMAGTPGAGYSGGMQYGRSAPDRKPLAAAKPAPANLFFNPGEISNRRLAERLAESPVFREFQQAFEAATSLPLTLRSVESWKLAHVASDNQNGFCALMSRTNKSCSACLQLQQRVCDGVNGVPCTLSCSFGLRETAVGVKIGKEIVLYLQTGQVFFKPPTPGQTRRALNQIKEWGLDINQGEAAKRYLATPVVRQVEYEARIKLLEFFGGHLGALAKQISFEHKNSEPPQVTRARKFIEEQYREKITLTKMAGLVNMNKFHFCRLFKKVTGANFTDYVTRFRVEEAKNLLMNIHYRISEIGFAVGFQSLAHFNRSFRGIAGASPTEYRRNFPSA